MYPKSDLRVDRSSAEVNGVEIGDSLAFLALNGAGVLLRLLIAVLGFGMGCFLDTGSSAGTLLRRSAIAVLDFGMGGCLYPNLLSVLALATPLLLVRREGILLSLGCRGFSSMPLAAWGAALDTLRGWEALPLLPAAACSAATRAARAACCSGVNFEPVSYELGTAFWNRWDPFFRRHFSENASWRAREL
jgi:hypothetical protein